MDIVLAVLVVLMSFGASVLLVCENDKLLSYDMPLWKRIIVVTLSGLPLTICIPYISAVMTRTAPIWDVVLCVGLYIGLVFRCLAGQYKWQKSDLKYGRYGKYAFVAVLSVLLGGAIIMLADCLKTNDAEAITLFRTYSWILLLLCNYWFFWICLNRTYARRKIKSRDAVTIRQHGLV